MAEPFIAEIRIFPFGYAPPGWAPCDGRTLQIKDNAALFSLLADRYGGDGFRTFALPDLRGAIPVHPRTPDGRGTRGGSTTVTVTADQMIAHTHPLLATATAATINTPENTVYAQGAVVKPNERQQVQAYSTSDPNVAMNTAVVAPVGGGKAHNNMMPYLALNYCMALTGVFPPRS